MQKKLFDRDPQLGITKYWHVKDNGEYVVETVQDVTGIAEYNKRSRSKRDPARYPVLPRATIAARCGSSGPAAAAH